MRRLITTFVVACLIGIGAAPAVLAQSPSPGPPYPDPIDGVRVYDYAGVLSNDTISEVEATIRAIEERSGAEVVVLTQVKPESDTIEKAQRDAIALIDQWGVGRAGIDDGLAILFDLEPNLCHGQVQLFAGPGYAAVYLTNEERQAIFEGDMLPALRECDIDAALLAAMKRIDAATRPDISVGVGRRVEMPEAGIALTFPGDWMTHEPTPQEA
ncbi:MAG: TPM domain-containing protein, partial [Chloroflexota bacterium]|nr:TPM domain-containing protein [Chloroflexota bacterium]